MPRWICAAFIPFVCVCELSGQTIRVESSAVIATEAEPRRFFEPHLAVHPVNPKHLLVGVVVAWSRDPPQEAQARARCAAFVSRDGGTTWVRHEFAVANCIDPQVAILPDGQAVFVALAELPGVQPKDNGWLLVFHSPDGGVTWGAEPTVVGRNHDHPAVAVDLVSPARKGWIYITTHYAWRDGDGRIASGVFAVRSRNAGKSFDAPTIVSPNHLHNYGEMPAVLTDGTLIASFVDDVFNAPQLERRRAWVIRSTDGASTFSRPHFINDTCGPPPGFQLSSLVVDHSSGPFRGSLYFSCRQFGGGPIVVTASGDGGITWNRPASPVGPASNDPAARRVMTMAVNSAGVLGVFVAERRRNVGEECLEFSFSASFDGATTFTKPERLSISSCGGTPEDEVAYRRMPTGGDYFGLVATTDRQFRAVWPEMRMGQSVLLTTTIRPEGQVTSPTKRP